MSVNMKSLEQAIKDFNNWSGAAFIYYNEKEGYFNTEVFMNDVQRSGTVLTDDNFIVFEKNERESKSIGEQRKSYIIDFVKLVLDGWKPFQAEYHLYDKSPQI